MSELRDTRLDKAKTLEELGQGPYALTFSPSHRMAELQETHADLPKGEERDVSVSVAGRVMTRRVMGKLAFFPWPMRRAPFNCSWRRRVSMPSRRAGSNRSPRWWTAATGLG